MIGIPQKWRKPFHNRLQAAVPIVAFTLFAAVAAASFVHGAQTKNSVDTFRKNVLGQSVTSNDSALASAIVAFNLSEYLGGKDVEDELRERIDVVTTQLALGATNFTGNAVEHTLTSQESWTLARLGLMRILNGERDPALISATFKFIKETRIYAKRAADEWITQVLSKFFSRRSRSTRGTSQVLIDLRSNRCTRGASNGHPGTAVPRSCQTGGRK